MNEKPSLQLPYYAAKPDKKRKEEVTDDGFFFKARFDTVKGSRLSEFRNGRIQLSENGVILKGRAIPLNMFGSFFVMFGWEAILLIVCVLLEGVRLPRQKNLLWTHIQSIMLVPKRRCICLIYNNGQSVSLVFTLKPSLYEAFVAEARRCASNKVMFGKIQRGVSPLIVLLTIVGGTLGFIWFTMWSSAPGHFP